MPEPQVTGEHTAPYTPIFDTGGFASQPGLAAVLEPAVEPEPDPPTAVAEDAPMSEPHRAPAHPAVVPGAYQYLKRWTFVLVVIGVWLVADAIGVGLYYWWYHALDKTPAVFVVLVYLVVTTVASLLVAMVQNKPLMSALAIGLMSGPLAATAAAAVLHGVYFCDRVSRCLMGVIPY